jgi:hypothetical protein
MVSASRGFAKLAIFGLALVLLLESAARAEIDLNRLVFPKVPSSSGAPAMADDPPPQEPATMQEDRAYSSALQNPGNNRVARRPNNGNQATGYQQPPANQNNGRYPNAPASYQSTTSNYAQGRGPQMQSGAQNGSQATNGSPNMGGRPSTWGAIDYNQNQQATSNPQMGSSVMTRGGSQNYPQMQNNNSQRQQWSVAGAFGLESSGGMSGPKRGVYPGGLAQNSPQMTMGKPTSAGPMVTPDAVYLEGGESIPAGVRAGSQSSTQMEGSVMMPQSGGMMMEGMPSQTGGGCGCSRGADGYSNPYCNDCSCGGPSCGSCGGDCDSCGGGGCGCGLFHGVFGRCGSGNCGECDSCGDGESCGECGHQCPYGRPWILAPIDLIIYELSPPHHGGWWWGQDFEFFGGVHNFRSNVNITNQSNFGTQEGVNWGIPIWSEIGLGGQIGVAATQSNFERSGIIFDDYRQQTFITGGLFHRPACGQGFQFGAAFDWLHDEFYDNFDVAQVRGEISYLFNPRDEIGFECGVGVIDDQVTDQFLSPATFEVLNQYNFYYRRNFCRGGNARIWGGFTDENRGLVGVDFSLPMSRCWAIEGGFNYVVEDHRNRVSTDETWNMGMNLVWYIGGNAICRSQYRPLFNVGDNGSLLTRITHQSSN